MTQAVVQSEEAEGIGYIIPNPVIDHFLTDFQRNGCFTAFPSLGIEWQKLENPGMRKCLGMQVRCKALLLCLAAVCYFTAFPSLNIEWQKLENPCACACACASAWACRCSAQPCCCVCLSSACSRSSFGQGMLNAVRFLPYPGSWQTQRPCPQLCYTSLLT